MAARAEQTKTRNAGEVTKRIYTATRHRTLVGENTIMSLLRFFNVVFWFAAIILFASGCEPNNTSPPPATVTITVNGVVQNPFGAPISGATVIISNKPPVTTGSNGEFSVSNVTFPYDAILIAPDSQRAIVYQGLTRQDPHLHTFSSIAGVKNATITGTVPASTTQTTIVFFVSGTKSWLDLPNPVTGTFSIAASWSDTATSFAGKIYLLRWNSANGFPTFYDAVGSKDLTINDGGIYPSNDFIPAELSNPPEQNVSGTISLPAAFTLSLKGLKVNIDDASIEVATVTGFNLPLVFNYTVPVVDGFTFEVDARASGPDSRSSMFMKKRIPGGTDNIAIRIDTPPHLTLPHSGATGVDSATQFQWTPGAGVYFVNVDPNGPGSYPSFFIFTMNTSTFLPNLATLGLVLPPNTGYRWQVTQHAPVASTDFVASDEFLLLIYGQRGDIGWGTSETFLFTTD